MWEILFVVFIRAPSSNGAFTPALKSYCFKLTCLANASLPSIITVQSGEEALLKVITVKDRLIDLSFEKAYRKPASSSSLIRSLVTHSL